MYGEAESQTTQRHPARLVGQRSPSSRPPRSPELQRRLAASPPPPTGVLGQLGSDIPLGPEEARSDEVPMGGSRPEAGQPTTPAAAATVVSDRGARCRALLGLALSSRPARVARALPPLLLLPPGGSKAAAAGLKAT